jgi:hypothetical protein
LVSICSLTAVASEPPGPLTKSAVVAGMSIVKPLVARCHERHRARGLVFVQVDISERGVVTSASVEGGLAGTPAARCVEDAVLTARFPPSDRGLRTSYPFMLGPRAPHHRGPAWCSPFAHFLPATEFGQDPD